MILEVVKKNVLSLAASPGSCLPCWRLVIGRELDLQPVHELLRRLVHELDCQPIVSSTVSSFVSSFVSLPSSSSVSSTASSFRSSPAGSSVSSAAVGSVLSSRVSSASSSVQICLHERGLGLERGQGS